MEPPQVDLAQVIYTVLAGAISLASLFLVASYEATFTILSKSALEKLAEGGLARARTMLRIYEPHQRLRLMVRLGESISTTALALALYFLLSALAAPYGLPAYPVAAAGLLTTLASFSSWPHPAASASPKTTMTSPAFRTSL